MGKQVVTVEMAKEFNRRYNTGETQKSIALDYNITSSSVGRYIWKPRKSGRTIKDKEKLIKWVKELIQKPHTVKEITEITGICQSTIYVYLRM